MLKIFNKKTMVWIVGDGTDSVAQSRSLAKYITTPNNIFEFDRLGANSNSGKFPDLAIGVGYNVADNLLGIKERSGGKTKIAIILDPLKEHDKFDFIILPSYEPYNITGENVIRTTGLINYISPEFLDEIGKKTKKNPDFSYLNEFGITAPFCAFLIGGRHTGGNIAKKDITQIANTINKVVREKGGTALITTSKRTESGVVESLEDKIDVPYFLYDYNFRQFENPYDVFLSLADDVFVTGDSVRMMSEAVSSGKNVYVFEPEDLGFQYKPLIKELIVGEHAIKAKNWGKKFTKTIKLNEAKRVAELICERMGIVSKDKDKLKPKKIKTKKIKSTSTKPIEKKSSKKFSTINIFKIGKSKKDSKNIETSEANIRKII